MVFIAYNHKGQPISIVNAKSEELAIAYWHGAGVLPHTHKSQDDFDCTINGTGVVTILKTKESSFGSTLNPKILVVDIV